MAVKLVHLTNPLWSKERSLSLKFIAILSMCGSYMVYFLTSVSFFKYLMAILALFIFFACIPKSKMLPKYFSIFAFIVSVWIILGKGKGIEGILQAISTNVPLLTLLILVPLISIPIKSGNYLDSIYYYLGKLVKKPVSLFASISLSVCLLGPILHLGSIRLINEILQNIKLKKSLLARAFITGFTTVVLWSPFLGSVALTLYYLRIPITDYLLLSLPLAFLLFLVGNVIFISSLDRIVQQDQNDFTTDQSSHGNKENEYHGLVLGKLLMLIFLFIVTILLIEKITHWNMMFIISSVSIVIPLVWAFIFGKKTELIAHFELFKNHTVPNMNNEMVMFISAGLLAAALSDTLFAHKINLFLQQISVVSFLLFALVTILMVLMTTLVGIHPIVVVTILASQIDPEFVGSRPEAIALLLMLSWAISAILSPTNPLNIIVSESVNFSSFTVGFKWNGLYVVAISIVGLTYIYWVH